MEYILNIFRGMLIGIANVIPGVSGGTMAVILGIYDKLTEALGDFIPNKSKRISYLIFLVTFAIGVVIGFLLFAKLFVFLLSADFSKQLTYLVFAGLIIGAVPFIFGLHDNMKPNFIRVMLLVVAFFSLYLTSLWGGGGKDEITNNPEILSEFLGIFKITSISFPYAVWLVILGILAAFSMVLPGFSGSALLVSLGEYSNILNYVDERMIVPVAFVALGAMPGIFMAAKLMSYMIKKYPPETYYFIIGLIVASCVQVFSEVSTVMDWSFFSVLMRILSLIAGFILSYLLTKIKK